MTDQTDRLIEEVQSKNKAVNYERDNTDKLHTLQDIWNNTNGLDNITEHMKRKWDSIIAGGK
jgi:ribosomal protein L32E|tara:strand:+ start:265 stop:450 length:186 start_codon:yes stop_codon:yes gene_type:complete